MISLMSASDGTAHEDAVVLYTTEPCGFCAAAKELLGARGIPYQEVFLDRDERDTLVERTGLMTFPQLRAKGRTVGGFHDLVKLDRDGRLHETLLE